MRITLTHREGRFGLLGIGRKVHFIDAQIEFNPDEMDIVRQRSLDKYIFITGGEENMEYPLKNFMRRPMTIRFGDFLSAQAFEQEFKDNLAHLKTAIAVAARPTNQTDTFEM